MTEGGVSEESTRVESVVEEGRAKRRSRSLVHSIEDDRFQRSRSESFEEVLPDGDGVSWLLLVVGSEVESDDGDVLKRATKKRQRFESAMEMSRGCMLYFCSYLNEYQVGWDLERRIERNRKISGESTTRRAQKVESTFSMVPAANPTTTSLHFQAATLRLGMSIP